MNKLHFLVLIFLVVFYTLEAQDSPTGKILTITMSMANEYALEDALVAEEDLFYDYNMEVLLVSYFMDQSNAAILTLSIPDRSSAEDFIALLQEKKIPEKYGLYHPVPLFLDQVYGDNFRGDYQYVAIYQIRDLSLWEQSFDVRHPGLGPMKIHNVSTSSDAPSVAVISYEISSEDQARRWLKGQEFNQLLKDWSLLRMQEYFLEAY